MEYKDYLYAPVRMNFARTGEIFNIGVIVMDENQENRVFKSIDSFTDISNCLRISEPTSHDFTLNMLKSELSTKELEFGKEFSNTMQIETPEWITSDKSISDTASELFEELVTVKRAIISHSSISINTPTKVISNLQQFASDNKYKRLSFRNRKIGAFNKQIDAVVYEDDATTKPLIGVDVATPAVKDFFEKSAFSAMALSVAVNKKIIQEAIMYMPYLGNTVSRKDYKETVHSIKDSYKITVIDTEDSKAFFEELDEKAKNYGSTLY